MVQVKPWGIVFYSTLDGVVMGEQTGACGTWELENKAKEGMETDRRKDPTKKPSFFKRT